MKQRILSLLLGAMVMGCGGSQDQDQHRNQRATKSEAVKYPDEQVLDGIMFRSGPVATEIPEIAKDQRLESNFRDEADLKAAYGLMSFLKEEIKKSRPNYLSEFASNMRSGDHLLISQTLRDYSSQMNEVLKKNAKGADDSRESLGTGKQLCVTVAAAAAAVVTVAAAATVVIAVSTVAVSAVAYVTAVTRFWEVKKTNPNDLRISDERQEGLIFESTVNSIATRLKN